MIDIRQLREKKEEYKRTLAHRQMGELIPKVDKLLSLDKERRRLIQEVEALRAKHNQLSSQIEGAQDQRLIENATQIKEQIQTLQTKLNEVKAEYRKILWQMPNWTHPDVPVGKDENDNVVTYQWGKPTQFDFEPRDHVELGEKLELIDISTAAKVSGTRFNYLKNEAVLLQFALVWFVLEEVTNPEVVSQIAAATGNPFNHIFIPVVPPVLMRPEVMERMARLSPIEDRFVLEKDNLVLVGSAEHTLGPMHLDEILEPERLPLRYLGYSTAFRQEAGSYGKDTRGILRVHQFDKLEFESFTLPEHGKIEQDFLVAFQEHFLQKLKIPYQRVLICTGDMGKPDYRQIDLEAWIPSQNRYRETHTSDYVTDYQARRLNTRTRTRNNEKVFVHMNDATALAIGRTLIAILENYQQKDGSVLVPEVLQPYLKKEVIRR